MLNGIEVAAWRSRLGSQTIGAVALALFLGLVPSSVRAGAGQVVHNGSFANVDLILNFTFSPSTSDLSATVDQLDQASQILWDATEGQFQIGTVTFVETTSQKYLADIELSMLANSATVDGLAVIGKLGYRIKAGLPNITGVSMHDGFVLAHELGHYVLGAADEYVDVGLSCMASHGACFGDPGGVAIDAQNNCIMQACSKHECPTTPTELCTHHNHDLGKACLDGVQTETQQSRLNGVSCFETVVANYHSRPYRPASRRSIRRAAT